jgi:hypothetical protein
MLLVSSVPRALETKTRLFGFELSDLILIFLYLSVSNLLLGQTRLKFPVVWIGTVVIAGILFFIKRNRPEGFLQHWGEHMRAPQTYTAGPPDLHFQTFLPLESEHE